MDSFAVLAFPAMVGEKDKLYWAKTASRKSPFDIIPSRSRVRIITEFSRQQDA